MKTLCALGVGLVMLLPALVRAQADPPAAPRFTRATLEQSEKSLGMALVTRSDQMQISGARTVKELKALYPDRSFSFLVIPLMAVIKDEHADPNARISAAVALHGLNSAMGDYAILSTAQFTNDERVKHTCTWLAYNRLLERNNGPSVENEEAPELAGSVTQPIMDIPVEPLEEFTP